MGPHRLPPLLAGALQSIAIMGAFVGLGLGWAGALSLYNGGVKETQPPAVWLVDGFNVLHAGVLQGRERGAWWTEDTRARLLELAESFDDAAAEVWVVFDGPRPPPALPEEGRLRVVFAPSADEWLLSRLKSAPDPSKLAVVTGDRRLAARSRHRGAQVVKPREFLERCRGGAAESEPRLG